MSTHSDSCLLLFLTTDYLQAFYNLTRLIGLRIWIPYGKKIMVRGSICEIKKIFLIISNKT